MNFHTEIAHKLYVWNTKIDDIVFSPFDFIEAMHEKAPYKGKVFYQNLMLALPHHWGYEVRHDFFNEVWQYCEQKLSIIEITPPQPTETKTDKLKAPVLALFCNLINASGINKKDETESVESYCKRICEEYKLIYTDRIRQNFNGSDVKKTRKELIEKILPLLKSEIQNKIQKHLDSKNPPKQNLYA